MKQRLQLTLKLTVASLAAVCTIGAIGAILLEAQITPPPSGGGKGTVTQINTTAPIKGGPITTTGTLTCDVASGSQPGCLSAANWTTFNNKGSGTVTSVGLAGTANQITVTGSTPITASGSWTLSLPSSLTLPNGTVGTTQSASDNSTKIATTAYVDRAATIQHVVQWSGGVSGTGVQPTYIPVQFSCTVVDSVDMTGNPSGSATVNFLKAASAIPVSGDNISASAPATLASAAFNLGQNTSTWTQSVSPNNIFGINVLTLTTITSITVVMHCH